MVVTTIPLSPADDDDVDALNEIVIAGVFTELSVVACVTVGRNVDEAPVPCVVTVVDTVEVARLLLDADNAVVVSSLVDEKILP